jgi:hypothetical protein
MRFQAQRLKGNFCKLESREGLFAVESAERRDRTSIPLEGRESLRHECHY